MSLKFKRRIVREKVLQVLYAYEINNENLQALTDSLLAEVQDENLISFGKELINKIPKACKEGPDIKDIQHAARNN